MSRLRAMDALRRVYDGKHLNVKHIHHAQAKTVEIISKSSLMGTELDGEYGQGQTLRFDVKQGTLNLLS